MFLTFFQKFNFKMFYSLMSLFLTWGNNKFPMAIFPEEPTWWSPGVRRAPICACENHSTRQPNQLELRMRYTMSFSNKLPLMTFLMKSKISSSVRFNREPSTSEPSALPLDHQHHLNVFLRYQRKILSKSLYVTQLDVILKMCLILKNAVWLLI